MNLIIGDSHILALQNYANQKMKKNTLYEYSASSIKGLTNYNSISGTRNHIMNLLKTNKYEKLFIMFGKVDIEWVYPYKKKSNDINFNEFITEIVEKYLIFLNEISNNFNTIYVMGLHLPSLQTDAMIDSINSDYAIRDVSNKASIVSNFSKITQLDTLENRTQQIIDFNNLLKAKLMETKYNYIDITDELLDKDTNVCKNEFIIPKDHHLNRNITGARWFEKHLESAF